mmetsp:Transcript_36836/g.86014  ORF Transcript_36836/g.86014 Transcript_36836/m.86014 type:complete len:87 (+) Transcript_36836:184-444(+)
MPSPPPRTCHNRSITCSQSSSVNVFAAFILAPGEAPNGISNYHRVHRKKIEENEISCANYETESIGRTEATAFLPFLLSSFHLEAP